MTRACDHAPSANPRQVGICVKCGRKIPPPPKPLPVDPVIGVTTSHDGGAW